MRKGNTYALTKEVMAVLAEKPGVEFTEINISDLNLPFCASCHLCFSEGEEFCPHNDTALGIRSALAECDGVIIGSATYMWAINAALKNLLDHLAYGFHRPFLFGKKGMVIATSKGAGEKGVTKYIKTVLGQLGINGAVVFTLNEKEKQLQTNSGKKLNTAAERFYSSIVSNRQIKPTLKNIVVHNAFRAMALSKFSDSERDTRFWGQPGFHNKAYPAKAGAFKYAVGAAVYGIAKRSTEIVGRIYEKRKKARE